MLNFPKSFPSDKCFMLYLSSVLTDVCQVLCLVRLVGGIEPRLCTLLNLSICDQQIIANLLQELDLPKYATLKQRVDAWAREMPEKLIRM